MIGLVSGVVKTILISCINHKKLCYIKLENDFNNMDEVIGYLLQCQDKLKVMEKGDKF